MRNVLKFIIIAPVFLVLLGFALANRQWIAVSFDPFNSGGSSSLQIETPFFIVMIVAAMFGVLLGWASTWLRHGRVRKALRDAKGATDRLRAENESLRGQLTQLKSSAASTSLAPSRNDA